MQNKKLIVILLAVLVLLLIVAAVLYSRLGTDAQPDNLASAETEEPAAEQTEEETNPAPDFTVLDYDGNEVSLSDLQGKPVVLNFWASWCSPCKNEMPDFEEAANEYAEELQFMMVNCTDGYQESVESAKAFIEESGYTFPVYFDTEREAAYTYGASSIPMTFFIDAEGNLIAYGQGMMSAETLQKGIDMILSE